MFDKYYFNVQLASQGCVSLFLLAKQEQNCKCLKYTGLLYETQ